MSDKAETVTCDECFGRYKPETCPKCSGTGVRTTGEVDKSEDNPSPETDVSAMNVPVAVDNIEDKLRLARAEVERLATVYADHSATIAEQAAEIERLKGEPIRGMQRLQAETIREQSAEIERLRERVNGLEQLHASWADGSLAEVTAERNALRAAVDHLKGERDTLRSALEIAAARSDSQNESISYFEQESASHDAALAELTTDRDTLRLEVEKLAGWYEERRAAYAALEAERDELKRLLHVEKQAGVSGEFMGQMAALEAERDALKREARKLKDDWNELGVDLVDTRNRLRDSTVCLDEANARAEKYLAVIRAKDLELAYVAAARNASIKSFVAMAAAGLSLDGRLEGPP